jgi:hypothetical protein
MIALVRPKASNSPDMASKGTYTRIHIMHIYVFISICVWMYKCKYLCKYMHIYIALVRPKASNSTNIASKGTYINLYIYVFTYMCMYV